MKMFGPQVTMWFVISIVILAGVYDIVALLRWGSNATITHYVRQLVADYPLIPFAMGLLVMHLLSPRSIDPAASK